MQTGIESVKATIAPLISEYTQTSDMHRACSERTDRLIQQRAWSTDDSRSFKADMAYAQKLNDEMDRMECTLNGALMVLYTLFGYHEVHARYPELCDVAYVEGVRK